ncbi:SusC/RagA family TonB-linked outer membrane protein [Chitinophaga nivalis]|uniref:TonB-dependent receptor n=1 Tax=Chitinophaga nivalis TaxID=2991709 RepID=A0ABT3IJP7_9BACT|nr:TonB-dependent receptor [Chitinophaga nivalis]MCW3466109.1 TonB-dependent receptor [Chitinophaga nivalis]MCW3484200.1 TonB-dependent receptor [Chitinophaga nivalis]
MHENTFLPVRYLLRLFFILFTALPVMAQQQPAKSGAQVITGIVTATDRTPLPGVTIRIKGGVQSAITNEAGRYQLSADTAATLLYSYVGYLPKAVKVTAGRNVYHVTLEPTVKGLNDVVVVGYGTVKRKDLTGAVGEVKMADMAKAPVSSFEEALGGRVAGVQVSAGDGQPGSPMNIVIRGNNSVTQENSPLYVIDGFPVENPANNIFNPEEIASIEVLKDASATAIYGARGANGVIMITTKKGKTGAPVITWQTWMGFQQNLKKQEMMNPYEFVKYQLEQNNTLYTPIYLNNGKTLEDYKQEKGIDWQDLVFRNAFQQNHSLSMRGGNEKTTYAVSGSLLNQDGIIINSGFRRYQARLALDQQVTSQVKAGINVNYTGTKTYGTVANTTPTGPTASLMYSIWGYRPVTGNAGRDASLTDEPFDPDVDPMGEYRMNPIISTRNEYNPVFNHTIMANAYIDYKPARYFTLRISGGITKEAIRKELFNNSNTRLGHPKSSTLGVNGGISQGEKTNWLNENTLTYARVFNKAHSLNVVGGMSMQKVSLYSYGFTASQLPNESLGMSGLDEGIITTGPTAKSSNALMSFLGRVNYGYKSRYLFTLSFRADGSSKFPAANRWAYFPSVAVAWRLIEEGFMKDLPFLSEAKIRAGYGMTGNNRVPDFAYLSALQLFPYSGYSFGNSPVQGIIPGNLGYPGLKWETTGQTDIGLDLGFLNNRITLTADYYRKNTRDLLLNATLAPSLGYLNGIRNIGKVTNEGIELTLNAQPVQQKKFTWSTSFNISFNRNKVLQLNEGEPSYASRITWGNFNNAYPYIAIPGHPIAMFYGFLFDGIYQYSDFNKSGESGYVLKDNVPNNGSPRSAIQPGYIKFRDINGDGQVDNNDQTIIGNPNPVHTGGFSNNFTYRNFDLHVFFQWSYGNDILNANRIEFENGDVNRPFLNMFASYANRWTPEHQSNTLYKVGGQGPLVYSSRTIEDGSYLRLKTVALGYNFPAVRLKPVKIKSCRIYAAAQNLFTWTRYSGLDPEVSVRQSALTPGFDWSAYPKARTLTVGLDLTF